ncbi:MAG TPA: hypothetical protein VJA27_04300, partial [Patescibacteria group bacterium]|nr:hypothetical protein [Patescibacteria group bacterium]
MPKQKLFLLLLSSALVGFLLANFVIPLKQLSRNTSLSKKKVQLAASQETVPNDVQNNTEDILVAVYRNRKYGFQIKYPIETVASEYPAHALVGHVVSIGERLENGNVNYGKGSLLSVYAIRKMSADEFIAQEIKSEAVCKEKALARDSYGYCLHAIHHPLLVDANPSTSTFVGLPSVIGNYLGEGREEGYLALPTKGLIIYYRGPFFLQDFEPLFSFIDEDRKVINERFRFAFNCPAFWTCEFSRYFEHDEEYEYTIEQPGFKRFIFAIAPLSTGSTENLYSEKQEQFKKEEAEFQENVKRFKWCEVNGDREDPCRNEFYMGVGPLPPARITKTTFLGYEAVESNWLDGMNRIIYVPEKGIVLQVQVVEGDAKVTANVINMLFSKAKFF